MSWDAPQAEWWICLHKAVTLLSAQYPEAAHVLSLVPEHVVMPERGPVGGGASSASGEVQDRVPPPSRP